MKLKHTLAALATRNFGRGHPGSRADRAAFMLAAIPVNSSWAALAALLWLDGPEKLKIAAVAIWCGQLVFTQQYRHQPQSHLHGEQWLARVGRRPGRAR